MVWTLTCLAPVAHHRQAEIGSYALNLSALRASFVFFVVPYSSLCSLCLLRVFVVQSKMQLNMQRFCSCECLPPTLGREAQGDPEERDEAQHVHEHPADHRHEGDDAQHGVEKPT